MHNGTQSKDTHICIVYEMYHASSSSFYPCFVTPFSKVNSKGMVLLGISARFGILFVWWIVLVCGVFLFWGEGDCKSSSGLM